jgi:hypothetical protein
VTLIRRYAVALGYLAALAAGTLVTHALPAAARTAWIGWVSTSVANLATHPIPSLVLSALVTEGDLVGWLVVGAVGLLCVNHLLGNGRTLLLIAAVQTIGTYASEGLTEVRVELGQLPASERYLTDVGPSFVVVGALMATIGYGRWPARLLCALAFAALVPSLFGGLPQLEVASVGHLVSIVTALVLGWPLVRSARRPVADSAVVDSAVVDSAVVDSAVPVPSVNLDRTPGYRRWFRLPARRRGPGIVETPTVRD